MRRPLGRPILDEVRERSRMGEERSGYPDATSLMWIGNGLQALRMIA
jgi:hypothetical protein